MLGFGERGLGAGHKGGRPRWEAGVAGHPPLVPHYIGGSPKSCSPSLRIRPQHQNFPKVGNLLKGGVLPKVGLPPFP